MLRVLHIAQQRYRCRLAFEGKMFVAVVFFVFMYNLSLLRPIPSKTKVVRACMQLIPELHHRSPWGHGQWVCWMSTGRKNGDEHSKERRNPSVRADSSFWRGRVLGSTKLLYTPRKNNSAYDRVVRRECSRK